MSFWQAVLDNVHGDSEADIAKSTAAAESSADELSALHEARARVANQAGSQFFIFSCHFQSTYDGCNDPVIWIIFLARLFRALVSSTVGVFFLLTDAA